MQSIIRVQHLSKTYPNKTQAVKNVSWEVRKGEVFGLLGPNGAGKSTILEILEVLREKTKGTVRIGPYDLDTQGRAIKKMIGVQLQFSTFYPRLRLKEIYTLYAGLLQKGVHAQEVLQKLSLTHKANAYYTELSGGEKQRVAIGIALLSVPEVLYLDEPSTSLDPNARRNIWRIIHDIKSMGTTIILSTHYMEEAERLCDRVGILNEGNMIAIGTPKELIEKVKKHYDLPEDIPITLEEVFVRLTQEDNDQIL